MKLSLLAVVASALVGVGSSANDVEPNNDMKPIIDIFRSKVDLAMFEVRTVVATSCVRFAVLWQETIVVYSVLLVFEQTLAHQ